MVERGYSYLKIFLFFFLCFAFAYPGIALFFATPLQGTSWELQDPVVGFFNFMPGYRVLRYELLNLGSHLWSGLRNFGGPVLGNEVQAAPLFPLTILFSWLPERIHFNVLILVRNILSCFACYLLANRHFRLSAFASFFFGLMMVLSTFPARWMNHTWQNGYCAGLWLLFFCFETAELSRKGWGHARFRNVLGLSLAAFSLITCGFPESAALMGLIILICVSIYVGIRIVSGEIKGVRFLLDCALGLLIAFAFGMPQILALIEYMHQTLPGFRSGIGVVQFDSLSALAKMMIRFTAAPASGSMIHFFNPIPVALSISGIYFYIRGRGKRTLHALGVFVVGLFFYLKCFPVWPWFNQFVGNLPVLRESWFIVYFLPMLILPVAFFAAHAVDMIATSTEANNKRQSFSGLLLGVVGCFLLVLYCRQFTDRVEWFYLKRITIVNVVFWFVLFHFLTRRKLMGKPLSKISIFLLVIAFILQEQYSRPVQFDSFSSLAVRNYFAREDASRAASLLIEEANLGKSDYRERSSSGEFLSSGIGSIDNGAPAIVTERSLRLRNALFKTGWGGYLPIEKPSRPDAFQIVGAGFAISANGRFGKTNPDGWMSDWKSLGWKSTTVGQTEVYFDRGSLSRAYLASDCIVARDAADAAFRIGSPMLFYKGQVIIESNDPNLRDACEKFQGLAKNIRILNDRGSRIRIQSVKGPAWLVINDSWYPGWTAKDLVSGNALKLVPANVNFRAVWLSEERQYIIEFHYLPTWWKEALVSILVGIILVTSVYLWTRRKSASSQELNYEPAYQS